MERFPQSYLNQYGIRQRDRLVVVNDRPYTWSVLVQEREGDVGQPIKLTFNRDGQTVTVTVPRIDARSVRQYSNLDPYYEEQAKRTQYR